MGTLLIHGGDVYTPFEGIEDGAVLARDGRIERVGRRAEVETEQADVSVDAAGRIICPGFVDLQVNGGGGALLTEEPTPEALERMTRAHVAFGTTAMLPTVVTASEEAMTRALAAVSESMNRPATGARILGSHLEGPFISPVRKGAHREQFIRQPRRELFDRLLDAARGALRIMTLAPELPGARELIEVARAASVVVSVGHTEATFDEAVEAFEAGASLGTHVFNAMHALTQREPGVIGALLQSDQAVVSVIADGVHVHPSVLRLVYASKRASGVALITDAMPPVGTDMSSFRLQDAEITVRDGACYLSNGTLAGSALSMNRAVRLMRDLGGAPLIESVQMATATPARVLGMQDEIGALKPGARADIVICDHDLDVWKVFVGGELAYEA